MATHGTIDLETIDTSPSATVLSLGAVKFNQTVDLTAGFDHSFINKSNYKQNNQLTS